MRVAVAIFVVSGLLAGCFGERPTWKAANALVVDCTTDKQRSFHVHLAANGRNATVLNEFKDSGDHLNDMRDARRSAGTYKQAGDRIQIDLFLKDGAFGEAQGELVQFLIDKPSMDFQLIALSPGGGPSQQGRLLAQGRCVTSPYSGLDSHQLHPSSDKFTTKALAEQRAQVLGCEGAHAMGSIWMPCTSGAAYDKAAGTLAHPVSDGSKVEKR